MSGCEKYQELISRLIDEDLDGKERAELAAHLENCRECALMYSAFSGLSAALASEPEEMPEDLHESIMAGVRREHLASQNRRRFSRRAKKYMAAAACFALLILAAAGASSLLGAHSESPVSKAAPAEAVPYFTAESQAADSDHMTDMDGSGGNDTCVSGEAAGQSSASAQAMEPTEEQPEPKTAADTISRQLNCSWEELSAFLSGEPCPLGFPDTPELFQELELEGESGRLTVEIYGCGGNLCFTLSSDEMVYSTQRSQAELEAFLADHE